MKATLLVDIEVRERDWGFERTLKKGDVVEVLGPCLAAPGLTEIYHRPGGDYPQSPFQARIPTRHLLHAANDLDFARAHRPSIGTFSRWRWAVLCLFGLRHRRGERFFEVRQGHPPRPVSRCTRCGVRPRGKTTL